MEKKCQTVCFLLAIFITAAQCFAWEDICSLGEKMNYMTTLQLEDYYKDNLKGRFVEGKGVVRNVWSYNVNKHSAIAVDCGNDVIVYVATSSGYKELNAGTVVTFDGHCCLSYSRRRYVDTKRTYMHFELDRGSIK